MGLLRVVLIIILFIKSEVRHPYILVGEVKKRILRSQAIVIFGSSRRAFRGRNSLDLCSDAHWHYLAGLSRGVIGVGLGGRIGIGNAAVVASGGGAVVRGVGTAAANGVVATVVVAVCVGIVADIDVISDVAVTAAVDDVCDDGVIGGGDG